MIAPLVITPGDPHGIGPEITWKWIQNNFKKTKISILCIGARQPFDKLKAPIIEAHPSKIHLGPPNLKQPFVWLLPAPTKSKHFLPGFQSGWSVETAVKLIQNKAASAVVTGPISKERLQKGGYPYRGHTDLLADLLKTKNVTMMLANPDLKVSLVTTHLSLEKVPKAITRKAVRCAILNTQKGLKNYWKIKTPKIAVLGLNPHAGEAGLLGTEEKKIIQPEIRFLQKKLGKTCQISGPYPADTFFTLNQSKTQKNRFDAVICMYHDQGLIPIKLLDFPRTVNVTLGLSIIRTSVDHGVAFDIVGKNQADPSSLGAAIQLAETLVLGGI